MRRATVDKARETPAESALNCSVIASSSGCYFPSDATLGAVVKNQATEPLAQVTLTVAGKSLSLTDVPVGGSAEVTTLNDGPDSHWTIRIRFASGKELASDDMGYVTNGFTFKQEIIVTDDEIRAGGSEITDSY